MCCNPKVKIFDVICDSLMFFYLVISMLITIYFSNATYFIEYPKLLLYAYGFIFAKLVVKN